MSRAVLTLTLLIGIMVGLMLGVAWSTRGTAAWTSNVVTVRVYAAPAWTPLIQRSIADYNAVMPARGPRLVVRVLPERSCGWVKRQRFARATITVCSQPDGDGRGWAVYRVARHRFVDERARITLVGNPGHDRYTPIHQQVVCHELVHALTAVRDAYDTEPESCVRGSLDVPGAWDVALLERVYRARKRGR